MTDNELTHAQQVEKAKELLAGFTSGMLITSSADGNPHARPMSIVEVDESGRVSFITALGSPKVEEILHRPAVVLTMQSDNAFVSASGDARIVTDADEKGRLWSLSAAIWFKGPDDPEAAVIQLKPDTVEYWDRRGLNSVRFFFEAVRAVATGEKPREDSRGHARVRIRSTGADGISSPGENRMK